jgi:hypothetical protein
VPRPRSKKVVNFANEMANEPAAAEQQEGQSWMRFAFNFVAIFFAVNAVSSFVGGKWGAQNDVSGGAGKPAGVANVPALWSMGTKMVDIHWVVLTAGHENLPRGERFPYF